MNKVTGERVIPELYLRTRSGVAIYLMHLASYKFALPYVKGKKVLEVGCGTGYGTKLMSEAAQHIDAIDASVQAIEYAKVNNLSNRISFKVKSDFNYGLGLYDVVVSFQVVEHVLDDVLYMEGIYKALKPGGIFIVATPDRETRLFPWQKPWNEFHLREYSADELSKLLSQFSDVELYQMSAKDEIYNIEMERTRSAKWILSPLTFPLIPEFLRVIALKLIKGIIPRKNLVHESGIDWSVDDIYIRPWKGPSLNLIALARKNEG